MQAFPWNLLLPYAGFKWTWRQQVGLLLKRRNTCCCHTVWKTQHEGNVNKKWPWSLWIIQKYVLHVTFCALSKLCDFRNNLLCFILLYCLLSIYFDNIYWRFVIIRIHNTYVQSSTQNFIGKLSNAAIKNSNIYLIFVKKF